VDSQWVLDIPSPAELTRSMDASVRGRFGVACRYDFAGLHSGRVKSGSVCVVQKMTMTLHPWLLDLFRVVSPSRGLRHPGLWRLVMCRYLAQCW
jgi:hypothetical protein